MSRLSTSANATNTTAKRLLSHLEKTGVDRIFGVVGREAAAIGFDEAKGIEFILTRHEFTAGVMADVYARITNKPQVCFSTIGPGLTNLMTGIATSTLDRSPVLAISAQVESHDAVFNQTHQCLDNVNMVAPLTRFAKELKASEDIESLVNEAIECAWQEPVGPSYLSLPIDRLGAELSTPNNVDQISSDLPSGPIATVKPDYEHELEALVKEVEKAKYPIFILGSSLIRANAEEQTRQLIERLNIPAVTTYLAKGILPEGHPLNYGAITGYMDGILQFPALETIFKEADLIIALGYDYAEDLRPSMWNHGKSKVVSRIAPNTNPTGHVLQPDIDLVGDLHKTIVAIDSRTQSIEPKQDRNIQPLLETKNSFLKLPDEGTGILKVQQVVDAINQAMADANAPGAGTFVSDIGFFRHYAVLFGHANQTYGFLTSAGGSSFGYGLPAAMAAQMARPDEPVVMIAGDGGFHSNSGDLETVARLGLPIVMIVVNSSTNGLIELYQNMGQGHRIDSAVDFGTVDFVKLAEANGVKGKHVGRKEQLQNEITEALERREPYLIEVPISYDFQPGGFEALSI